MNMDQRILQKRIYKGSRSIKIMDEFESLNTDLKKQYDTLELQDLFCIRYRRKLYWVSLYLQRMPYNTQHIDSSLTFTELKNGLLERVFTLEQKDSYRIVEEVFEGIRQLWNHSESELLFQFSVPIQFNAQNSRNRSGYGNRYRGEELIYEGTLYGETTDYMFVSAKYRRW